MKKLLIPVLLACALFSTKPVFATDLTATYLATSPVAVAATYTSSGTAAYVTASFTAPSTQSIDPPYSGGLLTPSLTLFELSFSAATGTVTFSGSELPGRGQTRQKRIAGCGFIVLKQDYSGNYSFFLDCITGV